jgi:hypothetical protein
MTRGALRVKLLRAMRHAAENAGKRPAHFVAISWRDGSPIVQARKAMVIGKIALRRRDLEGRPA